MLYILPQKLEKIRQNLIIKGSIELFGTLNKTINFCSLSSHPSHRVSPCAFLKTSVLKIQAPIVYYQPSIEDINVTPLGWANSDHLKAFKDLTFISGPSDDHEHSPSLNLSNTKNFKKSIQLSRYKY